MSGLPRLSTWIHYLAQAPGQQVGIDGFVTARRSVNGMVEILLQDVKMWDCIEAPTCVNERNVDKEGHSHIIVYNPKTEVKYHEFRRLSDGAAIDKLPITHMTKWETDEGQDNHPVASRPPVSVDMDSEAPASRRTRSAKKKSTKKAANTKSKKKAANARKTAPKTRTATKKKAAASKKKTKKTASKKKTAKGRPRR